MISSLQRSGRTHWVQHDGEQADPCDSTPAEQLPRTAIDAPTLAKCPPFAIPNSICMMNNSRDAIDANQMPPDSAVTDTATQRFSRIKFGLLSVELQT